MDNFNLRKYLAEGRLLKEDFPNQKYYDLLNDLRDAGLLNKSGISGLQSKFNLSKEKAKEIFDEYLKDLKAEQPDAFDFFMRDLNEAEPIRRKPADEVFTDDELDYISDTMIEMYEKLGLDAGGGETDVLKAITLSDRIESFFQNLK